MNEMLLTEVSYRYKNGENLAINRVSCHFDEGEFCAVVGPSGSGKSTLLSMLAGLDTPMEGTIALRGEDLKGMNLDQYRRERVSMIFQAFQLFPLLTIWENVSYPMELCGVPLKEAKERARGLLCSVGIGNEKHKRYPSHLSGGEQQRVAIARALSTGAKVILADEPTGNLDTENGRKIIEILQKLAHEDGYCVVVVTHDMDIAALSDRVYQMIDGRLKEKTA